MGVCNACCRGRLIPLVACNRAALLPHPNTCLQPPVKKGRSSLSLPVYLPRGGAMGPLNEEEDVLDRYSDYGGGRRVLLLVEVGGLRHGGATGRQHVIHAREGPKVLPCNGVSRYSARYSECRRNARKPGLRCRNGALDLCAGGDQVKQRSVFFEYTG